MSRWLSTLWPCSPPTLSRCRPPAESRSAAPAGRRFERRRSHLAATTQRSEQLRGAGPQDHSGVAGVRLDLARARVAGRRRLGIRRLQETNRHSQDRATRHAVHHRPVRVPLHRGDGAAQEELRRHPLLEARHDRRGPNDRQGIHQSELHAQQRDVRQQGRCQPSKSAMPDSVRMGEGQGFDRHHFTPGLPLSPYSVVFKYDDRYQPGPTIRFVVWDVVYGKHYLASDEEGWHNGTYGYQFHLPVQVLPRGSQVIKPIFERDASSSSVRGGVMHRRTRRRGVVIERDADQLVGVASRHHEDRLKPNRPDQRGCSAGRSLSTRLTWKRLRNPDAAAADRAASCRIQNSSAGSCRTVSNSATTHTAPGSGTLACRRSRQPADLSGPVTAARTDVPLTSAAAPGGRML